MISSVKWRLLNDPELGDANKRTNENYQLKEYGKGEEIIKKRGNNNM